MTRAAAHADVHELRTSKTADAIDAEAAVHDGTVDIRLPRGHDVWSCDGVTITTVDGAAYIGSVNDVYEKNGHEWAWVALR